MLILIGFSIAVLCMFLCLYGFYLYRELQYRRREAASWAQFRTACAHIYAPSVYDLRVADRIVPAICNALFGTEHLDIRAVSEESPERRARILRYVPHREFILALRDADVSVVDAFCAVISARAAALIREDLQKLPTHYADENEVRRIEATYGDALEDDAQS